MVSLPDTGKCKKYALRISRKKGIPAAADIPFLFIIFYNNLYHTIPEIAADVPHKTAI